MSYVEVTKPIPNTTVIRMNRPERMNSMSFDLVVPLHEAIEEVAQDNDTHCVILTGTGRGFCAGADTQESTPPPNIDGMTLTRIATRAFTILADLVPALQRMPQPVICAVNGAAIGGGMCLTLGADIRLAGESAYFRAAGINNGLTAVELGTPMYIDCIFRLGKNSQPSAPSPSHLNLTEFDTAKLPSSNRSALSLPAPPMPPLGEAVKA